MTYCNGRLFCFQKTENCFFKVSKECFTSLAVGVFFLKNSIFSSCFNNERSFPISLRSFLCMSVCVFFLGASNVASFSLDWMQQRKHSRKRTEKMSTRVVSMNKILEKSSRKRIIQDSRRFYKNYIISGKGLKFLPKITRYWRLIFVGWNSGQWSMLS